MTKKTKELMLPLTTKQEIISDKSFPYKLLAKMTLESNRNEIESHRYIKGKRLTSKAMKEQLKTIGISESTFKRQIKKLKNYTDIVQLVQLNGDIAYKLYYKDSDNRNYTLVNAKKLRQILNSCNDTCLKVYMILLYTCNYNTETQVTQEWLLNKLGLSANSRSMVTDCLKTLSQINMINIRVEVDRDKSININGNTTDSLRKKNFITMI